MNKFKKLMCLFLSVLMILSMGIPAFAIDKATDSTSTNETQKTATATEKNPLTIEISTNKAEYKVTNVAEITARVTNTSNKDIKNVSAEAVFNDLAPVGKKTSETKKEVETLKAGESISFTYKATLNASEHKLNLFQKIFLWFVRLFNGGYTPSDNGFDNDRDCTEQTNTISFGKFDAVNTVRVWYGENGSISDDEDFTTKLENSHNVDDSIKELSNSNNYKNSTDEQKVSQMRSLLNKLENSGEIKNISYDNYVFSFQYKNGWKGGVVVKDNHTDCYSSTGSSTLMSDTRRLSNNYPTVNNISAKTVQNLRWTLSIGSTDTCQTMFELRNQYTNLGVPVQVVAPATVDTYKHLSENDFIYIQSHGNLINNKPWICTSEIAEDRKRERYEGDLDKNTIHIYYTDGIGYFWINPSFFEDNYQVNKLDNTIIYMGSCCSFGIDNIEDYSFYNSFKNAGARAVIGFCNSVSQNYSNCFGEKLLYYLSQGNTLESAFNQTKNVLGNNNNEFYENYLKKFNEPYEFAAYPILRGEKNAKLVDEAMTGFGSFTASIKDSRTNNAIENVAVEIKSGSGAEMFHLERTDITGIFTIALPEGQYSCTFVKNNYENKSIKFNIQNGIETVWTDPIYMTRQTGKALCAVNDITNGNAIENVKIEAVDISSKPLISSYDEFKKHEIIATATTDSKGLASLDLTYGSYLLAFTHDNYEYFMKEVEINAELDISAYDVKLTPKGSSGEDDRPVTASGNCGANGDNVKWVLYDDGELVISGQGEMADYTYDDYSKRTTAPWSKKYDYKFIKTIVIREGVTSIGNSAFYTTRANNFIISNTVNQINGTISNTVKNIYYNGNINEWCNMEVRLLLIRCDEYNLYINNKLLTDLVIPDSIEKINSYAFCNCNSIKSVKIGSNVQIIGEHAFDKCVNIEKIEFGKSLKKIGSYAFSSCDKLNDIIIPDSVISIEEYAFSHCDNLKKIEFGKNLKNIGDGAFFYCNKLNDTLIIPDSVETIGNCAFEQYHNTVKNLYLGKGVKEIGTNWISFCLENIYYNGEIQDWCNINRGNYNSCVIKFNLYINNDIVNYVEIPSNIAEIKPYTFAYCNSIERIVIPQESKTNIGENAFYFCENLQNVIISGNITCIEKSAFENCKKLTNITIPDSVTSIGYYAFEYCPALEKIIINNPNCTIYDSANTITDTATIYGYSGSTAESYAKKYNREFVTIVAVN